MNADQQKRIREKALELGKFVMVTDEYKNLREKTRQLERDEEAQKMILELEDMQKQIDEYKKAKKIPPELIDRFEKKRRKLNENKNLIAFFEAQKNFYLFMYKINNVIAEGISGINPDIKTTSIPKES